MNFNNNALSKLILTTAFTTVGLVGCGDTKRAAEDIKNGAVDTTKAIKSDVAPSKSEYLDKVDKKLVAIDQELKELNTDTAAEANDTRAPIAAQVALIQAKRDRINGKVTVLKNSTGDAWKSLKDDVDGSISDVQSDIDTFKDKRTYRASASERLTKLDAALGKASSESTINPSFKEKIVSVVALKNEATTRLKTGYVDALARWTAHKADVEKSLSSAEDQLKSLLTREDYEAAAKAKIDQLNTQIDQLRTKLATEKNATTQAANQEQQRAAAQASKLTEETVSDLQAKSNELSQRFKELQQASDSKWDDLKGKFSAGVSAMDQKIQEFLK